MENKIIRIVVFTLLIATVFIIVPNSFETKASSGDDLSIGLDYEYLMDITTNLSNVIHNESVYPPGSIPKGRDFGSAGDQWTANYLWNEMYYTLGLDNTDEVQITNDPNQPNWDYNYIVEATDFDLTINGLGSIPKSEIYAWATGTRNLVPFSPISNFGNINYENSFSDLKIVPQDLRQDLEYTCSYANLSYYGEYYADGEYTEIIGILTYVSIEDELPDDQDGRLFLLDEKEGVENHLESISSTASGVILIHDFTNGNYVADTSNCNVPVLRVYKIAENLTTILNLLESGLHPEIDN